MLLFSRLKWLVDSCIANFQFPFHSSRPHFKFTYYLNNYNDVDPTVAPFFLSDDKTNGSVTTQVVNGNDDAKNKGRI
jgi:hypothetical protein